MSPKVEKEVIKVKPLKERNPAAKSLEGYVPVTHKDRRKVRGGARNTTRYFEDDDYQE